MPRQQTAAAKYITELLSRFPDAPALTLAKKAYRERPGLWRDVEGARRAIRYRLGQQGKGLRKQIADKRFFREPRKPGWTGIIPEAVTQFADWKALEIDGPQRVLVLADIHIPFHDPEALQVALDYGLAKKPTIVLLNGDIADHYSISRWQTDPELRDFPKEINAVKQLLRGLRERFGKKCRVIFKHGNHEERFEKYMRLRAPELLGVPEFSWSSVFGLHELGVELVHQKRPIRLGKLNVLHGHEYVFAISNPVNPARGLFLRGKTHGLCGHFHQTSQHSEKTLEQKVLTTWSTGCLCDLHPEYRPLNPWNHGAAYVEVGKDGSFEVNNFRILHGRVW